MKDQLEQDISVSKPKAATALSIRNLDPDVRQKLQARAAENGRSLEAEARAILTAELVEREPEMDLFTEMVKRFEEERGIDIDLSPSVEDEPDSASQAA